MPVFRACRKHGRHRCTVLVASRKAEGRDGSTPAVFAVATRRQPSHADCWLRGSNGGRAAVSVGLAAAYSRPLVCSARGEGAEHTDAGPFPPVPYSGRGRGASGQQAVSGRSIRPKGRVVVRHLGRLAAYSRCIPAAAVHFWSGWRPVMSRRQGPRRRARPAAGVYSRSRTRPVDRRDRLSMRGRLYAVATDCIGVG